MKNLLIELTLLTSLSSFAGVQVYTGNTDYSRDKYENTYETSLNQECEVEITTNDANNKIEIINVIGATERTSYFRQGGVWDTRFPIIGTILPYTKEYSLGSYSKSMELDLTKYSFKKTKRNSTTKFKIVDMDTREKISQAKLKYRKDGSLKRALVGVFFEDSPANIAECKNLKLK